MTLTWPNFLTWGTCLISSFGSFKLRNLNEPKDESSTTQIQSNKIKGKKKYCGAININAQEQYCGAIKVITKEQYCGAINIFAKEIGFVDFSALKITSDISNFKSAER